jgi:hypothetical protein
MSGKYVSLASIRMSIAIALNEGKWVGIGQYHPSHEAYQTPGFDLMKCREHGRQYVESGFKAIDDAARAERELAWMKRTGRV